MTANSSLISVRASRALWRRGYAPLFFSKRYPTSNVSWLNGIEAKRCFDIVFASLVLVLCSPLYLVLAILIASSSPGPIFYVQERVGQDYRRFKCYKFRTMVINADEVLAKMMADCPDTRQEFEDNFKLREDPRITWIGKFLRMTSLDEFPQFWNVLKGDMSVVGPRPLIPDELQKYGNKMGQVLSVQPGLTGLWQVSGRNDIPYPERVQIDVYYVFSRTMLFDLWIILRTIGVVLFPNNNGAY